MNNSESDIVVVGGFGGSGSSAVLCLLKEVDSYFVPRAEFRLFTDPDGILSLKSALVDNWTMFQSDLALKRFRALVNKLSRRKNPGSYSHVDLKKDFARAFSIAARNYIAKLTDFSYKGLWVGICSAERRLQAHQFGLRMRELVARDEDFVEYLRGIEEKPDRQEGVAKDIYVSPVLTEEEFYKHTKEFIFQITSKALIRSSKSRFVFDEGFSSMNASKVLECLPQNAKMIVVSRDPRDQFVNLQRSRWLFYPENMDAFIKLQISLHKRWMNQKKQIPKSKLLHVRFEDLGKHYQETKNKIFKFLSIDESMHIRKKESLDPSFAKSKIGFWKKYLNKSEIERLNSGLEVVLKERGYTL